MSYQNLSNSKATTNSHPHLKALTKLLFTLTLILSGCTDTGVDGEFGQDSTHPEPQIRVGDGSGAVSGGTTIIINWDESQLSSDSISIEVSTDGGNTWTEVEGNIDNTGQYSWTVPVDDGDSYIIRVVNPETRTTIGESDQFTVDSTPPAAPTGISLGSPSTSPANDATPQLVVTGTEADATVQVFSDSACSTLVGSSTASTTTTNVTLNSLSEGSFTFYANQKDKAGNLSPCSTANVSYDLDLTSPSSPTNVSLNTPASSPSTNASPSVDVAGLTNGDIVKLYSDSSCSSTLVTETVSSAIMTLSLSGLSDGTYSFHATSEDTLGNRSPCSTNFSQYILDTTPPLAPTGLDDGTQSSSTTQSPNISWLSSTDATTGISHYEVAIGTSAGATDILNWKNVGNVTSHQETGLTLSEGSIYYASVRAVDNVGLSSTTQGDGWSIPDITPNAFTFTDQTDVSLSTLIQSNIVQITGLGAQVDVAITGTGTPQYRICNNSDCSNIAQNWTSTSGSISNNQYLQLQLISDASEGVTLSATATVGNGSSGAWSVTTEVSDPCGGASPPALGTQCADGGFYVGDIGGHGVVIAESDYYELLAYGAGTVMDTTSTTDGAANTDKIIIASKPYNTKTGAYGCRAMGAQWYLPAKDELNLIWVNRDNFPDGSPTSLDNMGIHRVGTSYSDPYYSSTEWDYLYAWGQRFQDGTISYWPGAGKSTLRHIRCARRRLLPDAFSIPAKTGATVSTVVTSDIIAIPGNSNGMNLYIMGEGNPELRVCDDPSCSSVAQAWTDPGATGTTFTSGQYLQVRLTTSANESVTHTAIVRIGGYSARFDVTNVDKCQGSPSPGDLCAGGPLYAGSLSPGATSGSGTDHYMTTPGRCDTIPDHLVDGGAANSEWTSSEFEAFCSGATDNIFITWNDGSTNYADIPSIYTTTTTSSSNFGASNTDTNYGSDNTLAIVNITDASSGGMHAAARYCDRLVYGGYSDWFLPNRYELNLLYTNLASLSGFNKTSGKYYWSSTEYSASAAWGQAFDSGYQTGVTKSQSSGRLVRCMRRY